MFKNLTALYVEDESQISNIVVSILESLFKKLFFSTNGEDALEIFKQNTDCIDLVITDINMPKMDGIKMCRYIRQFNKSVPIIITTAHNDKNFLHNAIELGVSKFVTKPMDMKLLIDNIKQSLEPIILKQKLDDERTLYEKERIKSAKFTTTGQLAAGITHEINTPLTYIKANFELIYYDVEEIKQSNIKDNILNYLSKIDDGLSRIENIVSSMKEISQATTIDKKTSNIYSSIITSAILAFNKIKHISQVYINGELFSLDMDKNKYKFMANIQLQRLEQVWIIIINNAMDELLKIPQFEKRRLNIDIYEENKNIIVTFKDNAGGIDKKVMPYLFEPFKGTKESSGMGIGLSIAKKIIEDQNEAKIEAFNDKNGAVFKISLKTY
ncbi:MAG: response regulator [Campylobacterota bacterium]|nr:response regulator [Campylobacterota bacterium]